LERPRVSVIAFRANLDKIHPRPTKRLHACGTRATRRCRKLSGCSWALTFTKKPLRSIISELSLAASRRASDQEHRRDLTRSLPALQQRLNHPRLMLHERWGQRQYRGVRCFGGGRFSHDALRRIRIAASTPAPPSAPVSLNSLGGSASGAGSRAEL